MGNALRQIQKRLRKFRKCGYDVPASRRFLLRKAGLTRGELLEVGTGKGHLAVEVARKGLQLTSVDNDAKQLSVAREQLKALKLEKMVRLQEMSAEKLKYLCGAFDAVISIDFFHHAKAPLKCLREMMRVAKNTIAIADLNKRGLQIMATIHRSEGRHHPQPSVSLTVLNKRLRKNGFHTKTYRKNCHTYLIARRKGETP